MLILFDQANSVLQIYIEEIIKDRAKKILCKDVPSLYYL